MQPGQPQTSADFATAWTSCCAFPGGLGLCCSVACCAPCYFGRLVGSLPHDANAPCAGNAEGGCCLYATVGGIVYGAFACLVGPLALAATPLVGLLTATVHVPVRKAFKEAHKIDALAGGCGGHDCLLAVLCDGCLLCQEVREMELRLPDLYEAAFRRTVVLPPGVQLVQVNPLQPAPAGYMPSAPPLLAMPPPPSPAMPPPLYTVGPPGRL